MNSLNGFEFGVLVIVALGFVPTLAILAWCWSVTNKRVQGENRDLVKALLAQSDRPMAAHLAVAMEETDRTDVQGEHAADRARHENGRQMIRRPAGAG